MIAQLRGVVARLSEESAVIDVNGVGYLVFCSSRTLGQLPAQGETVALEIETHVREDHIHLYAFVEASEGDWFRLLTKVQGVGARVALAILSAIDPDMLLQAVAAQDKTPLTRASGVGPKLAGRIVTELKDKVGGMALAPFKPAPVASAGRGATPNTFGEEAVSALVNLGYSRTDAFTAVAQANRSLGQEASLNDLIKEGLRELAS